MGELSGDLIGGRFADRVRQIPLYLRNDPYGEAGVTPRNERRSGRVFRRLQRGDQNVTVRNEQVFNGLIIRYNQMLDQIAGSGRVTNQNRQDLWRLYQELVNSEPAVNNRYARRNRRTKVSTTGNRIGLSFSSLGEFQATSIGPVNPRGLESATLFMNVVGPPIPANSLILNSSLAIQFPRVSAPCQVWLYGSARILPPIAGPGFADWINYFATPTARANLLQTWNLPTGGTRSLTITNPYPANPAFLNRNRRLLTDNTWSNLVGFMLLTDNGLALDANLTLTVNYIPPLDLKNHFAR